MAELHNPEAIREFLQPVNPREIRALIKEVERLRTSQQSVFEFFLKQMETLMATFEDLKREIAQNSSLVESVVALVRGLRDQLANVQAAPDPAKIQELIDELDRQEQKLAEAVASGVEKPEVPAEVPVAESPVPPVPDNVVPPAPVEEPSLPLPDVDGSGTPVPPPAPEQPQ